MLGGWRTGKHKMVFGVARDARLGNQAPGTRTVPDRIILIQESGAGWGGWGWENRRLVEWDYKVGHNATLLQGRC